jgi:hypothetical protein
MWRQGDRKRGNERERGRVKDNAETLRLLRFAETTRD